MSKPLALVINYGMGNLFSVANSLQGAGFEAEICADPSRIGSADLLVLPGVGAFGDAIATLRERGLIEPLFKHVQQNRPLVGICLGHQLLFERSFEFGEHAGLGLLKGEVLRLPESQASGPFNRVPNIGWSAARPVGSGNEDLFEGIPLDSQYYFVHSYYASSVEPQQLIMESSFAGLQFCSAVRSGSVIGFQFHPERSAEPGQRLYRNLKNLV